MNQATWVVVANSAQARIFSKDNSNHLKEIQTFVHPGSRLHEGDLSEDKSGCAPDGVCNSHSSWEQETSVKRRERIQFAKELTDFLETARSRGEFAKLYIAASPAFLGEIRREMNKHLLQCLVEEVDKDITHKKSEEIRTFFPYIF